MRGPHGGPGHKPVTARPACPPPTALIAYPDHQHLVEHREHHRPEKQPHQPVRQRPADHPGEDHRHRRREAPRDQERLQDVVEQADRQEPEREQHGRQRVLLQPRPDQHRDRHQNWPDLQDAQHRDGQRQQAGRGHPRHHQPDPDQQRLEQRHPDHPLRDTADRRPGHVDIGAAVAPDHAAREGPRRLRQTRAMHQQHPRQDHRQPEDSEPQRELLGDVAGARYPPRPACRHIAGPDRPDRSWPASRDRRAPDRSRAGP